MRGMFEVITYQFTQRPRDVAVMLWAMKLMRFICIALLAYALNACTAISLIYDSAPKLAQFELDGYIDMSAAQEQRVAPLIDAAFAWHRKTELPRYATTLRTLAERVQKPLSTADVGQVFQTVQGFGRTAGIYLLPQQAALALDLKDSNLRALQKKYAKDNLKFTKDWLRLGTDAAQTKRFEDTLKWLERVYGDFDDAQLASLRAVSDKRPLNMALVLEIRQARQAEILATLTDIVRTQHSAKTAETQLVALVSRLEKLDNPAHQAFVNSSNEALHALIAHATQIATPAQKATARGKLLGWADDAIKLSSR